MIAAMNLWVSIKCGEFLEQLRTCQLLRKDSAPWSLVSFLVGVFAFMHVSIVQTVVDRFEKQKIDRDFI